MSHQELERSLKELSRVGTLVERQGDRDVWRFEHAGRAYRLHFYPAGRRVRTRNSAIREFHWLTALQKANIPSPRAAALLSGFRIKTGDSEVSGDAVVLDALEPGVRLDEYLAGLDAAGEPVPDRRELALQLRTIVLQLGRAKFGHRTLGLESFILHGRQLYLADAGGVRGGGLRMKDVLRLGHSAERFATKSELLRAWETLGPGSDLPASNPVGERIWKAQVRRCLRENTFFGRLSGSGWSGVFTKRADLPRRWAPATRLTTTSADWQRAWPLLLKQIESDQLHIIKRGDSGDVLAGEVVLGGKPVAVIVKRPRRKRLRQYITDLGRRSRARRTWIKTWKMLVRNVPCEWPMLLMEKGTLGYVTDSVIVFGRVEGSTLAEVDLDAMLPTKREMLFRRAGGTLRLIESFGFTHMDAKSTNWMVFDDGSPAGPLPVSVDVDGVRHYRWATAGILRLLRAMKQHPQYTPADSLALCQGYAPRAGAIVEEVIDAKF